MLKVSFLWLKVFLDYFADCFQPLPALLYCTGHNHVKHFPVNCRDAAQLENTVLPEYFKRIAEYP
jgi:hypothetical protein